MSLTGWGRYPAVNARAVRPRSEAELRAHVTAGPPVVARGAGRAYGDSAAAPVTLEMGAMNRMLAFDARTGTLTAEAGVLLADIIAAFLPRGFFPRVTPGTKFVTLGGMIAADVHGKNHHVEGSMARCVDWIDVMGPDGEVRRASRDGNAELFRRTTGGMGLTGVILRAAIRLRRVETAWIRQTTIPAPSLARAMEVFEETASATYSVAWIDCLASGDALGRSLVMLGEHATLADLPEFRARNPYWFPDPGSKTVPIDLPGWALNRLSVRAFNALYWRKGVAGAGERLIDWDTYFYPLDAILGWNRIYGRQGFVQFQCALPPETARAGLTALLTATSDAGAGSFLAVLKRFGPDDSANSFPMDGYTLALDFPVSARTLKLLDRLDAITLDHGGRFYLAKDGRMTAETLRASDPRMEEFAADRRAAGWHTRFRSAQSERLGL